MNPYKHSIRCFIVLFSIAILPIGAAAYLSQFTESSNNYPLRWKNRVIPISISKSLFNSNSGIVPDSDVAGAILRSFATWEKAANVQFVNVTSEKNSASASGKAGDGVSLITIAQTPENLLMFGTETVDVSARTRVFFNRRGLISEADIVLNPYQQFSTDGSIGTFDLEATLTHEIGHLLGLDHSFISGATMNANQGKNGLYGLRGFSSRSLASDDFAGIRAKYGAAELEDHCCGSLSGTLSSSKLKPADGFRVWAEYRNSGRIAAGVFSDSKGEFSIEGLEAGAYKIYAKGMASKSDGPSYSVEELGIVEVVNGKKLILDRRLEAKFIDFELQYIGFSGQLSKLPVPLNGGKSYIIYLGGIDVDSSDISVGFSSPFITITPNSLIRHDFGNDLSVVSFEINLDRDIPFGEYSIFANKNEYGLDLMQGSISVGEVVNDWNSYLIPE